MSEGDKTYRNDEGYLVRVIDPVPSKRVAVGRNMLRGSEGGMKSTNAHYSHLDELHAKNKSSKNEQVGVGTDVTVEGESTSPSSSLQTSTTDTSPKLQSE